MAADRDFVPKPGFRFGDGPAPEVRDWLRHKALRPSFSYKDVWAEEHAIAFTAAKATRLDVLSALRDSVQKAVEDGVPFDRWKRALQPELERLGWWGEKWMADPVTGKQRLVQIGSRRLKTIYDSNMRAARAAGQWQRAMRTSEALPYILYELGPSENHRPEHVARAGMIRPVDDPIWQEWWPPNGYGCKCRVRQISRAEARRRGGETPAPRIPTRAYYNERLERIDEVPVGIDPGWHTNPGLERHRFMVDLLAGRLQSAPADLRAVAIQDMIRSWAFGELQAGRMAGAVPVGVISDEIARLLNARHRVVSFSQYTARKAAKHPETADPATYLTIQELLDSGEVIRDPKNPRVVIVIGEKPPGTYWRAVIKRDRHGGLWLSTFHRLRRADVDRYRESAARGRR